MSDPEWVKHIAGISDKSPEYKRQLKELFKEYINEGMGPKNALEKAKKTLECFGRR